MIKFVAGLSDDHFSLGAYSSQTNLAKKDSCTHFVPHEDEMVGTIIQYYYYYVQAKNHGLGVRHFRTDAGGYTILTTANQYQLPVESL